MSKFWEASSDSEPEIDEEGGEDGYSSAEEKSGDEGGEKEGEAIVFSSSDSDSEPETKREVRTARVKCYEEMDKIIDRLRGHMKEEGCDWDKMWTDFQELTTWIEKATTKQIVKEDGLPRPYMQMLCDVEDLINQTSQDKAALKAMNKPKAKAFGAMKHKVPKANKKYEADMARWRKTPDSFADPKEMIKKEKARLASSQKPRMNWASEEEPSEEEPAEEQPKPAEATQKTDDWTTVTRPGAKANTGVRKGMPPPEKIEWNDTIVMEWLSDIKKSYGHKKTDTQAQIVSLKELLPHAKATQPKVEIYKQIIASMLGRTYSNLSKYMKRELWLDCVGQVRALLKLITEDSNYHLAEGEEVDESESLALSMRAFVEQLDTEFVKSLQNIDPHTHEYVERLRDEGILLDLATMVQQYYEELKDMKQAARMAMKRIEHIYYKLDSEREKLEEAHQGRKVEGDGQPVSKQDGGSQPDLQQLCVLVYTHGDEVLRTRAMLCHVYHHALHGRYHQARDILLITHIQDTVQQMDVTTQILYNRALAQLGLCAFKNGLISEAYNSLADLCSGKTREYLAQGVSTHTRYGEKNPEQEKLEKQRQVPYHMHLSLELLEAVHLISAMLMEVPHMAAHPFDKPKGLSRFRKLLDLFERQVYTGPPETTRDYVITAAKALSKGDWKRCEELLLHLPVWDLVQGVDQVKAMLRSKIQEAGLRTYLFTYSKHYNSLSMDTMCQMFDLPLATANSIISKMMFNDELHASVDQPTRSIVMHKVEASKLQHLALQYAERLGGIVENNEMILDARTGCYGNKMDQAKPQKGDLRRKPYGRGGYRQKNFGNQDQRGRGQNRDQGQQRRPQWGNRQSSGKGDGQERDQYHQQEPYKRYIQRRAV